MNDIHELARAIIKRNADAIREFEDALTAGICPECGAKLQLVKDTKVTFKTRRCLFRRIRTARIHRYGDSIVCPNGHLLEHPTQGDVSYPGYCVWDNCIDPKIKRYRLDHYDTEYGDY
jgi:hypothetical protein